MGWASAVRKPTARTKVAAAAKIVSRPQIETADVDWDRLVSLDFETYYDADFTLSKLSTSEYVRDERFEASMVGIKIGNKKTKVVPHNKIAAELAAINWETHSVLCHNVQFDGFILSHHYGVFPKRYYCTLGMARGLHSNEIGAGLHDVSLFYGGKGKIDGGVEGMKGTRFKELFANKPLWKRSAEYCANDVDEMFRIFCAMHPLYPAKEMDLIHMTARMFCAPVLKIDIPRVQAEYEREVTRREELLLNLLNPRDYDDVLDGKDKKLEGKERDMRIVKKVVGSNERFVSLFETLGIARDQLPRKLSPAWMKKNQAEREEAIDSKWAFAFARDDLDFINMPEQVWEYFPHLDPANPDDVLEAAGLSEKLQQLIDTRIAVKSTTNITRAERFLKAGANGMSLPVGYAYYRAHTGRWGGNNKMNMQNLTRGGELRLSILAAKGHQMAVADSGQIEARVNAWLWDQFDLLSAFRDKRDVYSEFATDIYGRKITKEDKNDRHVGKVCVLGLGYQMGAPKLQMTLAKGALGGPKIALSIDQCQHIVNTYRRKYYAIKQGWDRSKDFIEHMANPGLEPLQYKCLEIGFEYIRLPNGMCLKYPDLRMAKGEKGWDEWSYQSGDIRKKIYGGLLCLAGDTEVLTDSGWKALTGVGRTDRVWDGVQWVSHDGVTYQGMKNVINFGGVWMTPDHRVFSEGGWHEAQHTTYAQATSSFARYFRAPSWFTDGGGSTWQRRSPDAMESSVRLWPDSDHLGDGVHEGQDKVVRVPHKADAQRTDEDARHVQASSLCRLAQHVPALPQPHPRGVPALRGARDQHLQPMADVCAVLGGHGGDVPAWPDSGAQGQQQGLLARKLCVGDLQGAVQQQTQLCTVPDASRGADDLGSDGRQWAQPQHFVLPAEEQMAHGETAIPVYDIVNAGPNRRFTVRGADGRPFVVHNCENLVQALARIIVAEQMLMIDTKYPVVMTTHDEAVTHPKTKDAAKCYAFMEKCMTTPLWWCPEIPLAAEGGFAENYSK